MTAAETEARNLRRALKSLTADVRAALRALDDVMRQPESEGRGKAIAAISNALEMSNDRARYFALGEDYRKDARRALHPVAKRGAK